jgi:hypothetical protein
MSKKEQPDKPERKMSREEQVISKQTTLVRLEGAILALSQLHSEVTKKLENLSEEGKRIASELEELEKKPRIFTANSVPPPMPKKNG